MIHVLCSATFVVLVVLLFTFIALFTQHIYLRRDETINVDSAVVALEAVRAALHREVAGASLGQPLVAWSRASTSCVNRSSPDELVSFTPDFANFRAMVDQLSTVAVAVYERTTDVSGQTRMTCGCLATVKNNSYCFTQSPVSTSVAIFDGLTGWGTNKSWAHNVTFPTTLAAVDVMLNGDVLSVVEADDNCSRAVGGQDPAGRWGHILPNHVFYYPAGGSTGPQLTVTLSVCVERDAATHLCVRAVVVEMNVSKLADAVAAAVFPSAKFQQVGVYDLRNLTLLSNTTDARVTDALLASYLAAMSGATDLTTAEIQPWVDLGEDEGRVVSAANVILGRCDSKLPLVVVVAYPAHTVFADALAAVRVVLIVFASVACAGGLLFACVAHQYIAQPLRSLEQSLRGMVRVEDPSVRKALLSGTEGKRNGRFLLEDWINAEGKWVISEVQELYDVYEELRVQLVAALRFLPQGVFDSVVRDLTMETSLISAARETSSRVLPIRVDMHDVSLATRDAASDITPPSSVPHGARPDKFEVLGTSHSAGALERVFASLSPNQFTRIHCTVLWIEITFPSVVRSDEMRATMTLLMDIVFVASELHGGIVESQRPDGLVVVFRPRGIDVHQIAAANCALDIVENLPEFVAEMIHCVLDTGEYYSGICGNQRRLSRVLFGPRVALLTDMVSLSQVALNCRIVTTERVATSLHKFVVLPVDFIKLAPRNMLVDALHPLARDATGVIVFALHDRDLSARGTEFRSRLKKYREGFAALLCGSWDAAKSLLEPLRAVDPFGQHASRLLHAADYLSQAGKPLEMTGSTSLVAASSSGDHGSGLPATLPQSTAGYQRLLLSSWDVYGPQISSRSSFVLARSGNIASQKSRRLHTHSSPPSLIGSYSDMQFRQDAVEKSPRAATGAETRVGIAIGSTAAVASERRRREFTGPPSGSVLHAEASSDVGHHHERTPSLGASFSVTDQRERSPMDFQESGMPPYPPLPHNLEDPTMSKGGVSMSGWTRSQDVVGPGVSHCSKSYRGMVLSTGAVVVIKATSLAAMANFDEQCDVSSSLTHSDEYEPLHVTQSHSEMRSRMLVVQGQFQEQAACMASVVHENVIAAQAWSLSGGWWFVAVSEWATAGSLYSVQRRFVEVPFASARRFSLDVAKGLAYLHRRTRGRQPRATVVRRAEAATSSKRLSDSEIEDDRNEDDAGHQRGLAWFAHGNLRPSNVLVFADGTCKLTDFGPLYSVEHYLAQLSTSNADETRLPWQTAHASGDAPQTSDKQACAFVAYLAPELLTAPTAPRSATDDDDDSGARLRSADIFALGLMLHEMITGSLPWVTIPETVTATGTGSLTSTTASRGTPVPGSLVRNDRAFLQLRRNSRRAATSAQRKVAGISAPQTAVCCSVDHAAIHRIVDDAEQAQSLIHLIENCLHEDPTKRYTIEMVLQHPLFY